MQYNCNMINKTVYIILIILIASLLYLFLTYLEEKKEDMINVPEIQTQIGHWARSDTCKYLMNKTTEDVLKENNIQETLDHGQADIYFPCGYNQIDNEIGILPTNDDKTNRVFIIDGADEITAKHWLWKNLVRHHGLNKAKQISPETFVLTDEEKKIDLIRLKKEHYPGKLYILKKNVQRQSGLHITDSVDEIEANKDNYILAQELLQDPYLVGGRKINLRVYVLVICHESHTNVYMFNDGFMYYTKDKYKQGNKSFDNHVTTGYIHRDVYIVNPLTHQDFKRYLDLEADGIYYESSTEENLRSEPRSFSDPEKNIKLQGLRLSDVIFQRIQNLLGDIFISFRGNICRKVDRFNNPVRIYKDYSIQLFGADVSINDQLQPQIMEINKGPDLSPKDDRDGTVKKKMMTNILELVGMIKSKQKNGFIKVMES